MSTTPAKPKSNPYDVISYDKLSLVATFGSIITSIIGQTIFADISKGQDQYGKYIKVTVDYKKLKAKILQDNPTLKPTEVEQLIEEKPKSQPVTQPVEQSQPSTQLYPLAYQLNDQQLGGCNCAKNGKCTCPHGKCTCPHGKCNCGMQNGGANIRTEYAIVIYKNEWDQYTNPAMKARLFRIIHEREKEMKKVVDGKETTEKVVLICGNKFLLTSEFKTKQLSSTDAFYNKNPVKSCEHDIKDLVIKSIANGFVVLLNAIANIGLGVRSIFSSIAKSLSKNKSAPSAPGTAKKYQIEYMN